MTSIPHVMADCSSSRCSPAGSHRPVHRQQQASRDSRLDYLLDNYPRCSRRTPNASRPGRCTARSLEACFTLSSIVCPLHGHKDARRDTLSPPPQLAAAAGNRCRSRSPLPCSGLQQHCESSTGVCSKQGDTFLPPGDRPFSPGYGWAEPGKGWTRSQSRSRSRRRPATPRCFPQKHDNCKRDSLSREPHKQREHRNAVLIAHRADATELTCGDDVHPRKFDDASVRTVDGITRERCCRGHGSCARDNTWAKSYLSREGALLEDRDHDTTEVRGGVARCQSFEKHTTSAHPASHRRRSREAATRWTGVTRLEEAESVKNELGCARSYNRGLRNSNSKLARQVAALRSRVDALASLNSTGFPREEALDATGLGEQVLYQVEALDECHRPRALDGSNASQEAEPGSMGTEMRWSGGPMRFPRHNRDEYRPDAEEEWTARRARQSLAPAPPPRMGSNAPAARAAETQTRFEVHTHTQTDSGLDAEGVAVPSPVAMGSSPEMRKNRGDDGGVFHYDNEAHHQTIDGPSGIGAIAATSQTGSMKQPGSLSTTNRAPKRAGFGGTGATRCERRDSSNDIYPCQNDLQQQEGEGTAFNSSAVGCNEATKSVARSLGRCGVENGDAAGAVGSSRKHIVEAVVPKVDTESSADETRLFLSERKRGGRGWGVRNIDGGINNKGNDATLEVRYDEVVSESCSLSKAGGGQDELHDSKPRQTDSSVRTASVEDAETVGRRSLMELELRSPAPFEGSPAAILQRGSAAAAYEDEMEEDIPSGFKTRTGCVGTTTEGGRATGSGGDDGAGQGQVEHLQLQLRVARCALAAFRTASLLARTSTDEPAPRPTIREGGLHSAVAFARWRDFVRDTKDSKNIIVSDGDEPIAPVNSPQKRMSQRTPEETNTSDYFSSNLKADLPTPNEEQPKLSANDITRQEDTRTPKGSVANSRGRFGEREHFADRVGGGTTTPASCDGRAVQLLSDQESGGVGSAREQARRHFGQQQMPPLPPRTSQTRDNAKNASCGDHRPREELTNNGDLHQRKYRDGASSSTWPGQEGRDYERTTGDIYRERGGNPAESPAGREAHDGEEWGQSMTRQRDTVVSPQEQHRLRRNGSRSDHASRNSSGMVTVSAGNVPTPPSTVPRVYSVESEGNRLGSGVHWKSAQQRREDGRQDEDGSRTGHGNNAGIEKRVKTPGGMPFVEIPRERGLIPCSDDDDSGSNGTGSTGTRPLMADDDDRNGNGGAVDGVDYDSEAEPSKPNGLTITHVHKYTTRAVKEQAGVDEEGDALGAERENKDGYQDVEQEPNNISGGDEDDRRLSSSYRRDCAVLAGTAKIAFALVALEHRRVSLRFYRWKRMRRLPRHDKSAVSNGLRGGTTLARWT